MPVGEATLGRVFNVIGEAVDGRGPVGQRVPDQGRGNRPVFLAQYRVRIGKTAAVALRALPADVPGRLLGAGHARPEIKR